jgi:hypothetical protein
MLRLFTYFLSSLIRVAVATEEAAINLKVTEARTVAAGVEVNNKVVMAAETLVEAMLLHKLVSWMLDLIFLALFYEGLFRIREAKYGL